MKRLAVAFTGPSNSGKTTLIEKISKKLNQDGFKVAIIKHDPKDKARFDTEGKDSYRFTQTKADVAVISPKKTTLFKNSTSDIDEVIRLFGDFDYLLVEGLKTIPLPRICIQRDQINQDYFDVSDVVATDGTIPKEQFPDTIKLLDLNDLQQILLWIDNNAKVV